jgi:hypothetical protein
VAARNREDRILKLRSNRAWQDDYKTVRLLWLAGFDVEFPFGTYWLRRFAGVAVKPPPTIN